MPHSLDIQKETFYNCPCSDCSDNCPRFSWDDDTHEYKPHMHTLIADGYRWCCTEMLFFNWPPRVMAAVRMFFCFFVFCSGKILATMPFVLPNELLTCLGIFRHPITFRTPYPQIQLLLITLNSKGHWHWMPLYVKHASITARNIRRSSSIKC